MRWLWLGSFIAASFLPLASATDLLESKSLDPCQADSLITASLFNVVFTPNNNTLQYDILANSSITGNVTVELQVIAYGYTAATINIDPCDSTLSSNFCPIQAQGPLEFAGLTTIPDDIASRIPGMRPCYLFVFRQLKELFQESHSPFPILMDSFASTSTRPSSSERWLVSKRSCPMAKLSTRKR
jgi:hypothetical protein